MSATVTNHFADVGIPEDPKNPPARRTGGPKCAL
jgi:hypothetical protein